MAPRSRLLIGQISPPTLPPPPTYSSPATSESLNADFVVILAALLCALVCVLGLIAVARCAWIRRIVGSDSLPPPPPPAANKGLKKKVLKSLPKLTFSADNEKLCDCAICLAEFAAGDEIRILPQCGHGFHVACIDTWLRSHSSCPTCRQILEAARCKKCGRFPAATGSTAGLQPEPRESYQVRLCHQSV